MTSPRRRWSRQRPLRLRRAQRQRLGAHASMSSWKDSVPSRDSEDCASRSDKRRRRPGSTKTLKHGPCPPASIATAGANGLSEMPLCRCRTWCCGRHPLFLLRPPPNPALPPCTLVIAACYSGQSATPVAPAHRRKWPCLVSCAVSANYHSVRRHSTTTSLERSPKEVVQETMAQAVGPWRRGTRGLR